MNKVFKCILPIAIIVTSVLLFFVVRQNIQTTKCAINEVLAQGEDVSQNHSLDVVWCTGGVWKMKPGCCFGSGDCDITNPCGSVGYTCDGTIVYMEKPANQ